MEKEIKKLESRQDVLDVWFSKGAVIDSMNIKSGIQAGRAYFDCISSNSGKYRINIYQILYSPESNFFEVMFPSQEDNSFDVFKNDTEMQKYFCVISKDTLARLLNALNNTTS